MDNQHLNLYVKKCTWHENLLGPLSIHPVMISITIVSFAYSWNSYKWNQIVFRICLLSITINIVVQIFLDVFLYFFSNKSELLAIKFLNFIRNLKKKLFSNVYFMTIEVVYEEIFLVPHKHGNLWSGSSLMFFILVA